MWRIATMVILTLVLGTGGCNGTSEEKAKQHGQEIWFEEYMHDYGQIEQDSDGTWTFLFKNLGDEAIVINRVRSSCGCTVPEWPREPIEPGETGKITVKYNTALTGTFLKSVTVYSTAANSPVKLQIKGKVVPAQSEEE
jgi:archaellum component FlaG (FlaF/FlaG flagellin family)